MPSSLTRAAFLTRTIVPLLPRHGLTLEQLALFAADAALALEAAGLLATKPKPQPPNPLPELPPVVDGLPGGLPVVEDAIPAPPVVHPWFPTRDQVRAWRGAFLANGLEPWGFMYPAWSDDRRARFRAHYRAHGWTHLPISVWAAYGGEQYDYRAHPERFRGILRELLDDGLIPCVVLVTDQFDGDAYWPAQRAIEWVGGYLPQIADLVPCVSLGWEQNQIAGWDERGRQGAPPNRRQGHDIIRLARVARDVLGPDRLIYLHLGPRWWAPHYEDGEEARWWGDAAGLVDGYLHNDWESPLPAALDYLLVLPSPHGWGPGIVGRLQALRVDVVSFEMARTPQRHAAVLAAVKADGRSVRYC